MALDEVVGEVPAETVGAAPPESDERCGTPWRRGLQPALRAPSAEACLLYGSFAFAVAMTFGFSPDDPFISLRYAWNLIHWHGPVFNPGQHVNGATSPAGVALGVVALLLPLGHTYLKLKLLSVLFGVLTLGRCRALIEALLTERWARMLALLATGSSAAIAISAASGLETTFYSFALVGLLAELCGRKGVEPRRRAGVFATLAVLARPEAIVVVGAVAAVAVVTERRVNPWLRVRWARGAVITEGVILLANRAYYGSWLPNTYYAKQMPSHTAMSDGYRYLRAALDPLPTFAWSGQGGTAAHRLDGYVLAALTALSLIGLLTALSRGRQFGYPLAAFAAQACFVVLSGGDWMYGARFLEPVIVVLYLLQALGAAGVVRALRHSVRPGMLVLMAFGVVGVSSFSSFASTSHNTVMTLSGGVDDQALLRAGGYGKYSRAWALMPSLMVCAPRGALVASSEAGFISFSRPDLRVLDLRGLTNSQIARTASSSMKHTWGVQDDQWWQPTSPVGHVILEENPVLIATVDIGPSVALNGAYSEVGIFHDAVALYERTGMDCPIGA